MGFGIVGGLVGALVFAPLGLTSYGIAVGFLLGLIAGFGERAGRSSAGVTDEEARSGAYRLAASGGVGLIVLAALALAFGAAAIGAR